MLYCYVPISNACQLMPLFKETGYSDGLERVATNCSACHLLPLHQTKCTGQVRPTRQPSAVRVESPVALVQPQLLNIEHRVL